jgi:hypothetical protein
MTCKIRNRKLTLISHTGTNFRMGLPQNTIIRYKIFMRTLITIAITVPRMINVEENIPFATAGI